MRHARDQIRALTVRSRLLLPPEAAVQDINMFLRLDGLLQVRALRRPLREDQGLRNAPAGDLRREAA